MTQELLVMYNQYDEDGKRFIENSILDIYENNINFFCRNYISKPYYEDLKQEVRIAVIEAIRKYNINSKARFDTYAYNAMKNTVIRKYRYQHTIRIPEYMDFDNINISICSNKMRKHKMKDEEYDIYDYVPNKDINYTEFKINMEILKKSLTSDEFDIAKLYVLGYNKTEISRMKHVSNQAIFDRFDRIKSKLKNKYEEVI